MLILDKNDMVNAASFENILTAVETAMLLYEKKEFYQPERMHADYEKNTLLLMPCFTNDVFGTKIISLFPENKEKNLPVINGLMILNDGLTGKPLAILNGAKLTALRTAAVGSVSIRHLTPDSVKSLGIIGAGVQGFHQTLFATTVRDFSDIYIYDLSRQKAEHLAFSLAELLPDLNIQISNNTGELTEKSQVIITATDALSPVLPDDTDLLKGKHFVGIGSYKPSMREYPPALFELLNFVFVDTQHAREESGDLIDPLKIGLLKGEQIVTFGKFLTGEFDRQQFLNRTTFFKSVGMALFDVTAAKLIYENAIKRGIGEEVEL